MMENNLLPFIASLRGSVASLASGNLGGFGAAAQGAITGRLLDYLLVQETSGKQLKADYYASIEKLLPEVEQQLVVPHEAPTLTSVGSLESVDRGDPLLDAVRELKAICASGDVNAFEKSLQLSSRIQSALLTLDMPAAKALRKAFVKHEADYCGRFEAAVDAQFDASEQSSSTDAQARNTRAYDEQALLGFIRQEYPDESGLAIEKSGFISGGTSKYTVLITLKNARVLPSEIILRGDAGNVFGGTSVIDEYRLIKTVFEHGGCVPKPLAVEKTGAVFGSPFMLVGRRSGSSIGHMCALPKQPNPALNADIAAKLATLHQIPASAFGDWISGADIASSAKALAWIEESHRNWAALDLPSPAFETAFDWLRRHAAINDRARRTLVHGDFGLNNILVEGNHVTAILDWEFAHLGNPAYDLGYFRCMAEPLSSWEHFLDAYEKAGAPLPDEDQLNYATLLATTRLAVMVCQVSRGFTSGAETGLVAAMAVGGNYYDMMVKRMGIALERVL